MMQGGTITLSSPVPFRVGDATVALSGGGTVEGALKMKLGVSSGKLGVALPERAGRLPMVELPLQGTVDQPRLDVTAAAQSLPAPADRKLREWTSAQLAALRSRDAESGLGEQETKLRDTLKPFTAAEPNK
jgi:autotransporter translocation and assembly factor TamB